MRMLGGGGKYSRLLSNTVLFGISNMSSKIISFLMTRLYTSVLSTDEYGTATAVVNVAWLLIPLVSLGITNAVIRFGLEKGVGKSGVFTGGLTAIGMGFAAMAILSPLVSMLSILDGYVVLLYIYVLVSCLRNMFTQFVRAKMYTKMYAADGILTTAYTLGFSVLFLVVLRMGTIGYILAILCADLLSAVVLFFWAKLWKYIDFKRFDKPLFRTMLLYSLPLVPSALFWWINSSSDTFFITYMLGAGAMGLYSAATRIPHLLSLFSTLFTEAWQLSAITDGKDDDRENFFTTIYGALMAVCFIAGAGLILMTKLIMRYLVAPEFYEAWQFVPFLMIAIIFSTLAIFLNSVYMLERKSKLSLYTMMAGGIVNLVLNWVLISYLSRYGVAAATNGAGLATLVSYLVVFILRAVNTRHFINIKISPLKVALNTVLLLAQSLLMMLNVKYWVLWCTLIVAAVVAINGYSLFKGLMQLVQKRKRNREAQEP